MSLVVPNDVYKQLYADLHAKSDVPSVAKKYGLPEPSVHAIFNQKLARNVRKKFHVLKARSLGLAREWKAGRSFCELASHYDFSPVMIASLILEGPAFKWSHPKFQKAIRDPSSVSDRRLRRDLEEANAEDPVYSPAAAQAQGRGGSETEKILHRWLVSHEVPFTVEHEHREHGKTPDFLFPKEYEIHGVKARWVESKATFGDETETRRNVEKQLKAYVELFGPGIVIYWHGITQKHAEHAGVTTETREFLQW